jgi:hypothetical protein
MPESRSRIPETTWPSLANHPAFWVDYAAAVRAGNPRVPLTPAARARVAEAKDTLRRAKRSLDPGRIVAELSFGFWERLLTHGPPGQLNYEMALWRPALYRAFPIRGGAGPMFIDVTMFEMNKHLTQHLK